MLENKKSVPVVKDSDIVAKNPERNTILARWRSKLASGGRLRGVAVDSALTASREDRDGADFLVVTNSGKFRGTGFGLVASLMPYDDANAAVLGLAPCIMPEIRRTPVFAGLCGVDPFRIPRTLILSAMKSGYDGVQNFPSVGFFDGRCRRQLERSGLGFGLEVEMIRLARELNQICAPLVFNREEALNMAKAGADALIFHRGLVVPGEEKMDPGESARRFVEALGPVLDIRPNIILLNQSAGAWGDGRFLDSIGDALICHGFFNDGESKE